jgi:hypothetical protein
MNAAIWIIAILAPVALISWAIGFRMGSHATFRTTQNPPCYGQEDTI